MQADHRIARDELIALLKEKLGRMTELQIWKRPYGPQAKGAGVRPILKQERRLDLVRVVDEQYAYPCLPCRNFRAKSVGMMRTCLSDGCGS